MFRIETFRLIRKTIKRFLSLAMIVMIGAGFMMGMTATPVIQRESVDDYFDDQQLFDLLLYSQYGFCDEDIRKILSDENVANVYASKTIDANAKSNRGREAFVKVSEIDKSINGFELHEGRMPEKANECLMKSEKDFARFKIGDTITLTYGDNDIHEYLKNDEFEIVGTYTAADTMCRLMESSTLTNEQLESKILIPNSNFIYDYYTCVYLTLEGADKYVSFSDSYNKYVEEKKAEIENLAYEQQNYLKNIIIEDATKQLEEKESLFEQVKSEGQKQLDEAKNELEQANITIAAYEAQLTTLKAAVDTINATIKANEDFLDDVYTDASIIEGDLSAIMNALGLDEIHYGTTAMDQLWNAYNRAIGQFNSLQGQLYSAKNQYEDGLVKYAQAKAEYEKQITDGELQLRLARQKVEELPGARWMILDRSKQYSTYMYDNTIKQMGSIAIYLPAMFFLVAALVCLTTMKRLVDEQRGQNGIFVALGYSNKQIIGKYVTYALFASITGGLVGVIIGGSVLPYAIYNTWRMLYELPPVKISFPLFNIALSILSFAVLMALVTAYVVNDSLKDAPATLMRPKAPKAAKKIMLEKIPFIWERLSFTSKITARNIFRYKSRFLMTVIGVAGCTGLLVLGFGLKDAVSDVVDIQYGEIFNHDYVLYLDEDNNHIEEDIAYLNKDSINNYVASQMSYATRIYMGEDEDTANMIVLNPGDASVLYQLRETDKKTPIRLSNRGVIVSEKFAINHDLKQGDYITLTSKDGIKAEVMVDNICEMYFQHHIFMSDALYENAFGQEVNKSEIAVDTEDLELSLKTASKMEDKYVLHNLNGIIDSFSKMIGALNLIIIVIVIVAGALAFVVVMNLTQVNVSERIREIATLKVLGFNNPEINTYIFKEIFLLSLIGGIIGLPIGVIEHRIVVVALRMEMIMFGTKIEPISFVYAYLITIIFTIIVLTFMKKTLRNVNMVESLKSVE